MELQLTNRIKLADSAQIQDFFQKMLNRLVVGQIRYGKAAAGKKYLSKLELELKAYKKEGNKEQLFNVANYALLEFLHPEHPKSHFDDRRNSVTRTLID